VVFTETAGSLTETYDGAAIGNWGTATVSTFGEAWQNTGVPGNIIGSLIWTEPAGEVGFNVVDDGTAFSEFPFESAPQPLPSAVQSGTVVIDANGDTVVAAVTYVDNGDTVVSMPGGTQVPDNVSTVSMLMLVGGALGLARQRNLGLAVVRSAD